MTTPEPSLTSERAGLIRLLHDSENEFLQLISGLTDDRWTRKTAPEGWSVQQIAEHIVLGEKGILAKAEEALSSPPQAEWEAVETRKTGFVGRVVPDRSRKAIAPNGLAPHHAWTRDETIARFKSGRARTLKFVEEIDGPLKAHLARHPFPVFDMLNAYQWLLYIPLHNVRHNRQIAEVL